MTPPYIAIFLIGLLLNMVGLWILTVSLFTICNFFFVLCIIVGAYNATSGYAKEIPLVGRFRIIKAL